MRYEPPIDRARLIGAVCAAYGVAATELTFLPVGFVAVCYVVRDARGAQYFLKLWPDTQVGRSSAARLGTMLRLTRALHERKLLARVPAPLPTRDGALWATFAGSPFALFPLLAGHAPPPVWPPSLQDELARTIATIHRATPALADVLPPREVFDISFEADLRHGLSAVAQIGPHARPGLRALRDSVQPRRKEILAQLERLHRLQQHVRRLDGPFVLCHTDIGGDNLLVDEQGRLAVLDWDDATVAPPEYDLYEARGMNLGRVIEVYTAAGGAGPLHLDHFAFVLLRRFLGDMTVRLLLILEESRSEAEEQDALQGIEDWGFAQWAALEASLADIAAAISSSAPLTRK